MAGEHTATLEARQRLMLLKNVDRRLKRGITPGRPDYITRCVYQMPFDVVRSPYKRQNSRMAQ